MATKKQISTSIVIHANKEDVWDRLYNRFGDISIFNPNLDGSYQTTDGDVQIGTERRCDLDSKTYVKETITAVEELESMSIDIFDGNMPLVDKMDATMRINPIDHNKTEVILIANFNTKPSFLARLMKIPMRKKLKDMLVGLKYHLETGKEVTKNTYKPIFNAFKQLPINQPFT